MKNFAQSFFNAKNAIVMAMCLGAFGLANAEDCKIGFINSARIMSESAPAKATIKKLEHDFASRSKELQSTQARLRSVGEKLEKDMPVLSETERVKRQRELADMSQDFQRKLRAYREDRLQRENEEMSKVIERVNKEISKIAKSNNYDMIVQDAVYISPKVDITDQVIRALNK